jgi:ATP dependent DNA ligase-like protein
MLATAGPVPTGPGWAFEVKFDGVRAIAYATTSGLALYSRNDRGVSRSYPDVATLQLEPGSVIDGELVAFDERGRPDFGLLQQQRMHITSPRPRPAREGAGAVCGVRRAPPRRPVAAGDALPGTTSRPCPRRCAPTRSRAMTGVPCTAQQDSSLPGFGTSPPDYPPYQGLTGVKLRELLEREHGIKVASTGNRYPVDPTKIRQRIAWRAADGPDEGSG